MILKLNDLWNLNGTFNNTALIEAVKENHTEIVELLLRHENIDITIRNILNQ